MLSVVVASQPPTDWDQALLSAGEEASFYQSRCQAEAVHCLDGAEVAYFRVVDGEATVAQALFEKHWFFDRARQRRGFFLPFLSCTHGPTILDHSRAEEILRALLGSLRGWALRRGVLWIQLNGFCPLGRYAADESMIQVLGSFGFRTGSWATLAVDLRKPEDELWGDLSRAARKSVNKCRRLGIEVVCMESYDEFQAHFWSPYVRAEEHSGRTGFDYPRAYWDIARRHATFYVARGDDGQTLAALGLLTYNGVAKEISSAIMPEALERKIPAQDLLHWELLVASKSRSCHTFDLGGFNPEPKSAKEEGIRRFKEKWGGARLDYATYERNVLPGSRQVLQFMRRVWR